MIDVQVEFTAPLWEWDARRAESWTFVSLPADISEEIQEMTSTVPRRGFGSLKVEATLGGTRWKTSIFPEKGGTYVLPVKKAVRTAEQLTPGDEATVTVRLLDV